MMRLVIDDDAFVFSTETVVQLQCHKPYFVSVGNVLHYLCRHHIFVPTSEAQMMSANVCTIVWMHHKRTGNRSIVVKTLLANTFLTLPRLVCGFLHSVLDNLAFFS